MHKSHRYGKSRILTRDETDSRVLTTTEPVFHGPENKELATSGQSGMGSPEISPMHKDGEPNSGNFCGPEHNKYRSINSSGEVTCEVCNK